MSRQGHLLVLGCGAVSQCALHIMSQAWESWPRRITLLDQRNMRSGVAPLLSEQVAFVQVQITPVNYHQVLAERLAAGDLLVDLAWNIDTCDLVEWCRAHGVSYVNTSLEVWDPEAAVESPSWAAQTLYVRHQRLQDLIQRWGDNTGPTAVLEHGANPGLVSHFTHAALVEIAQQIIAEKPSDPRVVDLQAAVRQRAFHQLARLTGVKVIHIAEHDSQTTSHPQPSDEFQNTWSVPGFYEECIAPAELGWGTHERSLPSDGHQHSAGPQNQIYLQRRGMDTWVRSWCPSGEFSGMVIRHGEAHTLSDRLTVRDVAGRVIYRPTVHYAYAPCPAARVSLSGLRECGYRFPLRERILRDEIESGCDELGCLLMGHDFGAWWIGSVLEIAAARRLVPHQNATVIQVAASVLAALSWVLHNPNRGVCLPEDLPHEAIIDSARPYLGELRSHSVDWPSSVNGSAVATDSFSETSDKQVNDSFVPWQFQRFL